MPCPHFEPICRIAGSHSRLPLIDEYDGLCHAATPVSVPENARFRFCNHGYANGECGQPCTSAVSALRYQIVKQTPQALEVLCVEELSHAPVNIHRLEFRCESNSVLPEDTAAILRAQAAAFCQAYLRRFS